MTATSDIRAHRAGDTFVLQLGGEIDIAAAPQVVELGRAMMGDPTTNAVIIEMGAVTFLDSSGAGALVTLRRIANDSGLSLRVESIPSSVRRVLQIAGLDEILGLPPDEPGDGPP